jgi:hypothetical protein
LDSVKRIKPHCKPIRSATLRPPVVGEYFIARGFPAVVREPCAVCSMALADSLVEILPAPLPACVVTLLWATRGHKPCVVS